MSLFQDSLLKTQLSGFIFFLLKNNHFPQEKFKISQIELEDDDVKEIIPIFQAEISLAPEQNLYLFLVNGDKSNQPFQLLLIGSESEKMFLIFLDLEDE